MVSVYPCAVLPLMLAVVHLFIYIFACKALGCCLHGVVAFDFEFYLNCCILFHLLLWLYVHFVYFFLDLGESWKV